MRGSDIIAISTIPKMAPIIDPTTVTNLGLGPSEKSGNLDPTAIPRLASAKITMTPSPKNPRTTNIDACKRRAETTAPRQRPMLETMEVNSSLLLTSILAETGSVLMFHNLLPS